MIEICTGCGIADPDCAWIDLGIGAYEYWGAPGYDSHEVWLTRCCEAEPTPLFTEPDPDLIPAGDVR